MILNPKLNLGLNKDYFEACLLLIEVHKGLMKAHSNLNSLGTKTYPIHTLNDPGFNLGFNQKVSQSLSLLRSQDSMTCVTFKECSDISKAMVVFTSLPNFLS